MKIGFPLRWILFSAFTLCLTLTLIGVALDMLFHWNYSPVLKSWKSQKNGELSSFLSESQYFSKHPFFGEKAKGSKNLYPLIESLWDKGLSVPNSHKKVILSLKREWPERRFKIPAKTVAPFFEQSLQYNVFQPQADGPFIALPFDFVALSQIHLAQNIEADLETQKKAIAQTRHLALLLIRSETFNYQLAALSILSKQKEFTDFLHRRHPAENFAWELLPQQEIQRFRNYLYATYDYLDFLVGAQTMNQVFIANAWPVGYCSIYRLKSSALLRASKYLTGGFPFEPHYEKELNAFRQIQKKASAHCESPVQEAGIDPFTLQRVPFLRRFIGLKSLLEKKSMAKGL